MSHGKDPAAVAVSRAGVRLAFCRGDAAPVRAATRVLDHEGRAGMASRSGGRSARHHYDGRQQRAAASPCTARARCPSKKNWPSRTTRGHGRYWDSSPPPALTWFAGRDIVTQFIAENLLTAPGQLRLVATRANGQPAFAVYQRDQTGAWHAHAVQVLTLTRSGIARIVAFTDPALLALFDLSAVSVITR
jgi:hypothetical protein